jgi:hypothetical protein
LHIAAGWGSEFCVPYLLEKGGDVHAKDADVPFVEMVFVFYS